MKHDLSGTDECLKSCDDDWWTTGWIYDSLKPFQGWGAQTVDRYAASGRYCFAGTTAGILSASVVRRHALSAYVGTYYNEAYGKFCIGLNEENLELSERDVRHLPMSHFQYDTFKVEHVKEDTDLYTIPLTFFDEPQGQVGGFALRMEPKVSDIIFKKYK